MSFEETRTDGAVVVSTNTGWAAASITYFVPRNLLPRSSQALGGGAFMLSKLTLTLLMAALVLTHHLSRIGGPVSRL